MEFLDDRIGNEELRRIIERLKADIEMQLRYLRHDRYDVVHDYWIAAVRKSAVWILLRLNTLKLWLSWKGCGHQKILEGPDIGRIQQSNDPQRFIGKTTIRGNFCCYSTWLIH